MNVMACRRVDEARLRNLPGYPWLPHCAAGLPALGGLRMHDLHEGPGFACP